MGLETGAIGFSAAGFGAIETSVLVSKDLKRAPLTLKLVALMGIPFGASLIAAALGFLWGGPLSILATIEVALPAAGVL